MTLSSQPHLLFFVLFLGEPLDVIVELGLFDPPLTTSANLDVTAFNDRAHLRHGGVQLFGGLGEDDELAYTVELDLWGEVCLTI